MQSSGRSHTPDEVRVPRSSVASSSRSAICFLVKYFSHISIPKRRRRANFYELIRELCEKMGGIGELESGPGLDMFSADGQPQSEIVLCP